MFDVDTDAAIRHIDMQGDGPELGQAGPVDTYKALAGMDTEPRPGNCLKSLINYIPPCRI